MINNYSLVIPVYNEAENILPLFESIKTHLGIEIPILICYDFDEDTTVPVTKEKQTEFPNLNLIKNTYNAGPLGAIKSGFDAAKTPFVIVMMADLSDDLASIPKMIEKTNEGFDVVCASRYMKDGKQIGGPLMKRIISRIAGISLRLFTGISTHDITNNFRLYSKNFLDQIKIESDGGFELAIELTAKAYAMGLKITEVPTTWADRTAGESRFRLAKWFPKYLKWYNYALTNRPKRN